MKEIVVISGKGGTGKTSITASFAVLGGKDIVVADCDVDAADMHILMEPDFFEKKDFYSGVVANIDQENCIKCGKCSSVCHFDAIPLVDGNFIVEEISCEGCGYCSHVCPVGAINMNEQCVGRSYISNIKTGTVMAHAKLGIGSENSGKLVANVKKDAKRLAEEGAKDLIVVDGSPGVGCPVVSSLSGASYVVLVTEPTVSGIHDLKRVHELVKKFKLKSGCIINKFDLNLNKSAEIKSFLELEKVDLLAEIPYDEAFSKAMTVGKTVVEYSEKLKVIISDVWKKLNLNS